MANTKMPTRSRTTMLESDDMGGGYRLREGRGTPPWVRVDSPALA
jgi:hypothetical protein